MIEGTNRSKPKLLVLCQVFYPELVSTGQTLTELCEVLSDLGVDIEVIAGPATIIDRKNKIPRSIEYHGMKIKRVLGTRLPKLNLLGRIANQTTYAISVFFYLIFTRSRRPILVLTNPPYLAFTCAVLRKLKIGNPYHYIIFDVFPDSAVNLGVLKANSFLVKLWDRFNIMAYKYAANIVVIGRCMREIIINKMHKYNVDYTDKIRFIHIWSDDRLIQSVAEKKNPLIREWNLEHKFIVSYSGNMGRLHDMETIMETVKLLKDNPEIVFMFIGEGYKKAWMMKYAQQRV
ncbi:MAG: glycosyltransferase family 4 protein, partial [bacterium]